MGVACYAGRRWAPDGFERKDKVRRLARLMDCRTPEDFYCRYISCWLDPAPVALVRGAHGRSSSPRAPRSGGRPRARGSRTTDRSHRPCGLA